MHGWKYTTPGKEDEVAYIKTFRHIFPGDLLVKHPADSKVVTLFHTDLLKHVSEKQLETMKVVAGRRFIDQFHEIRVSAQRDGWTAAQNEAWCKETLQKLLSIAKRTSAPSLSCRTDELMCCVSGSRGRCKRYSAAR